MNENEKTFTCFACGETFGKSESAGTDYSGRELCEFCRNDYDICDHCGKWTKRMDLQRTASDDYVCNLCAHLYYYECDECGVLSLQNRCYHRNGLIYCESCWENRSMPINDYHSVDVSWPKYGQPKNDLFFGIELEVDGGGCDEDVAQRILDMMDDHCVCEEDGSLDDGFEIITYPHSYEEMRALPWDDVCRYLEKSGYDNYYRKAGMHIHFSRAFFNDDWETITRYAFFFERFKQFARAYSRRDEDDLESWSAFFTDPETPCRKKEEVNGTINRGRYHVTNISKGCTIECRLFNSTTDPNLILANLELVKVIAEKAKHWTDEEAETASLEDWLADASENLITYVEEVYSLNPLMMKGVAA